MDNYLPANFFISDFYSYLCMIYICTPAFGRVQHNEQLNTHNVET